MGKSSTLIFFGILLVGFVIIQYCWVHTLQKDKAQKFKHLVVSGIHDAAYDKPLIASELRRSFFSKGLGTIPFEYTMGQFSSSGFDQSLVKNRNHLVLQYLPSENSKLTVVIPFWKDIVWRQMTWIVITSVILTIMILAIFCIAAITGKAGPQLFYTQRMNAVKNMMQQMETPLSTVSVAAEALRNATVLRDKGKIHYYQQVIDEENRRMNEQVENFLKDLK